MEVLTTLTHFVLKPRGVSKFTSKQTTPLKFNFTLFTEDFMLIYVTIIPVARNLGISAKIGATGRMVTYINMKSSVNDVKLNLSRGLFGCKF